MGPERPNELGPPTPIQQTIRTLCPEGCNLLIFAANQPDNNRLEQAAELQAIRDAVANSRMTPDDYPYARPLGLLPALRKHRRHVVHFSGHGTADGGIELAGPPDSKQHEPCSPAALVALFRGLAELEHPPVLLVLSWCNSDAIAEALVRWVPFAIGFPGEPGDGQARRFAEFFYQALAHEYTIQSAYEWACGHLESTAVNPTLHSRPGHNPGADRLV